MWRRQSPSVERVAQSVEHLTFNQRVPGSSPGALTTTNTDKTGRTWCLSENTPREQNGVKKPETPHNSARSPHTIPHNRSGAVHVRSIAVRDTSVATAPSSAWKA